MGVSMGGHSRSVALRAILLVSTVMSVSPAWGQVTNLEEIIVTPTGRPERRSQIPSTVQVIGGGGGGGGGGSAGIPGPAAPTVPLVTPTGRPELPPRIVGTTQVITRTEIERSVARSVAELLVENAVGFLGQWTPDQTQIVIRGANTEPQGRDFRSQVLVLINGHRAGTGNLAKLSLAEVDRIEIVRGPASVIYGSQNMGGVVKIIMKPGLNPPATFVEGRGGSWGLANGIAQTGGIYQGYDYFFGVSGGNRGDYEVGGGRTEVNTSWERKSGSTTVGYQFNPYHHV